MMNDAWIVAGALWGAVSMCLVTGGAIHGSSALSAGYPDVRRNDARHALWLLAAAIFPPLLLFPLFRGVRDLVRAADLPAFLPEPKEQSPGQLSIAAKQGGEVSEVRDGSA